MSIKKEAKKTTKKIVWAVVERNCTPSSTRYDGSDIVTYDGKEEAEDAISTDEILLKLEVVEQYLCTGQKPGFTKII